MNTLRIVTSFLAASLTLVGAGCVRGATPKTSRALDREKLGVVAVATVHDNSPTSVTLCSGALVAPNLVLTARHCVSKAITTTPSCDADGRSHNGAHLAEDADPSQISIYTGDNVQVDRDQPKAHAVRTLHPTGHVLCDADVAYLILDRPLTDVTVLPIRLHDSVMAGDEVLPVGFGGGTANVIGQRRSRSRSPVLSVGPTANADTGAVLGPREFEVDAATCRGDSGGPALDVRTGEIVGVVSRGGSCSSRGNHVYTRVDAYARLAAVAFAAAERLTMENVAQNNVVVTPKGTPTLVTPTVVR
jgi:Trypsin